MNIVALDPSDAAQSISSSSLISRSSPSDLSARTIRKIPIVITFPLQRSQTSNTKSDQNCSITMILDLVTVGGDPLATIADAGISHDDKK
jgi:hypothetical protein